MSHVPLSSGHRVIGITNGHFIHAGPLLKWGRSFYLFFYLGHESKIQESDAPLMHAFLSHHMLLVLTRENTPPTFF